MASSSGKRELVIVLVLAAAAVIVVGSLLTWALWSVRPSQLTSGLTNVATIGGIVSGLSLSGTAVLALSGRYTTRIIGRYGRFIRFVLFGGFTVLVAASLLCALSVVWADQTWTKFVLGFTIPLMLLTLVATALLINSAFAWNEPSPVTRTKDPYAAPESNPKP